MTQPDTTDPHWFACLVNRPESLGGPAPCDCHKALSQLPENPFQPGDAVHTRIGDVDGVVVEIRSPWTVVVRFTNDALAVYGVGGLRHRLLQHGGRR